MNRSTATPARLGTPWSTLRLDGCARVDAAIGRPATGSAVPAPSGFDPAGEHDLTGRLGETDRLQCHGDEWEIVHRHACPEFDVDVAAASEVERAGADPDIGPRAEPCLVVGAVRRRRQTGRPDDDACPIRSGGQLDVARSPRFELGRFESDDDVGCVVSAAEDVHDECARHEQEQCCGCAEQRPKLAAGGWPLYYFVGDEAARGVNGQASGGAWFLASPDGTLIDAPATSQGAEGEYGDDREYGDEAYDDSGEPDDGEDDDGEYDEDRNEDEDD